MNRLTIALDFDHTFTADGELWRRFIVDARNLGHRVLCVTARRRTDENEELIDRVMQEYDCSIPVYYTALASKIWHMENLGVKVDIWIDDDPKTLVNGH